MNFFASNASGFRLPYSVSKSHHDYDRMSDCRTWERSDVTSVTIQGTCGTRVSRPIIEKMMNDDDDPIIRFSQMLQAQYNS